MDGDPALFVSRDAGTRSPLPAAADATASATGDDLASLPRRRLRPACVCRFSSSVCSPACTTLMFGHMRDRSTFCRGQSPGRVSLERGRYAGSSPLERDTVRVRDKYESPSLCKSGKRVSRADPLTTTTLRLGSSCAALPCSSYGARSFRIGAYRRALC